jgi:molybdate transport system permease protein
LVQITETPSDDRHAVSRRAPGAVLAEPVQATSVADLARTEEAEPASPERLRELAYNQRRRPRPSPLVGLSGGVSVLLGLFLGLPLLGLVLRAFNSGQLLAAMQLPIVVEALKLSLVTTFAVLVLSLLLGSPMALLLARRNFRGKILVDTLIDLPIVLPPAVAGLALLLTFGRNGLLGGALDSVGIQVPFTTAAVVLASMFVATPFYVRAARSGFLVVPPELEEAGRLEGASEWQVFRYVTAPVAAPALFGGAILCWARALGEFGATIMFAGSLIGRTQTMPLAIYAALETNLDAAVALSVLLLAISFALLIAARSWLHEASEAP